MATRRWLRLSVLVAALSAATACAAKKPPIDIPDGRGAVRFELTFDEWHRGELVHSPVRNARIEFRRADGSKRFDVVVTDSTGVVTFNNLVPAKYAVRIRALGFNAPQREFTVKAGELRVERFPMVPQINCVPVGGQMQICG